MPPMLAPSPLLPSAPIMAPQPQDSHFMPYERLRSPIHFNEQCSVPSISCSSRRRSKATSRSRRRLPPRVETHAFDELPWISTLEAAPDHLNPWDIADLSLIPDADLSPSGPGPVRRRKTSLRSSPLAKVSSSTSGSSPSLSIPARETHLLSSSIPTPRSRFIPSRVLFHNLMPVSCDFRTEQTLSPCITSSPKNF